MEELINVVDWSRAQFALTAIYHWLFVPLTLGLGIIVAVMETIYLKTKSEKWLATTKFWMTIFGVNFAIGVATGIILEFEFGTNWYNYSRDVLWLEESEPQIPPRCHVVDRHRCKPVGIVDSGGQRVDAVSHGMRVQPRHDA